MEFFGSKRTKFSHFFFAKNKVIPLSKPTFVAILLIEKIIPFAALNFILFTYLLLYFIYIYPSPRGGSRADPIDPEKAKFRIHPISASSNIWKVFFHFLEGFSFFPLDFSLFDSQNRLFHKKNRLFDPQNRLFH